MNRTRISYGDVDLAAAVDAAEGSPHLLGALALLGTLRKDLLEEWSGPWSSTERARVGLARSLIDGDLATAAGSFDDRNWQAFLDALTIARGR